MIALRRWQETGKSTFATWLDSKRSTKTFTAAVTTGAGKTVYGSELAALLFASSDIRQVIIAVPSTVIASQWQATMKRYPVPFRIVTYGWILKNQSAFQELMHRRNKVLVIFDEIHHAGEGNAWGDLVYLAADARYRLMLSGTPFRDDEAKLPFVRYENHELRADFVYSYGEALKDGHVRPLHFLPYDTIGDAAWKLSEAIEGGTFAGSTDRSKNMKALNTAISPRSQWLKTIIQDAHHRLNDLRRSMPDAGGIIMCRDQAHAREVAVLVKSVTDTNPVLAISDNPESDAHIEQFRDAHDCWLIVVKKGNEGLDIPRLRVGVWATNITKRLTFLQFVGRICRQRVVGAHEPAYLYMPLLPELVRFAFNMEQMGLHTLEEAAAAEERERARRTASVSQFEPIDAQAQPGAEIVIESEGDALALLIQIQELAAKAIAAAAMGNRENLSVSLAEIRGLVGGCPPDSTSRSCAVRSHRPETTPGA